MENTKKKKIGLYFGSFNPIHIGHLAIANHFQQFTDLDEVWLVISPHSPFKDKKTLLPDRERLHLAHLALENYPNLKASDIEFNLPTPSYTIDTLVFLKEKYPDTQFALIMGEDNLAGLPKWKNGAEIMHRYPIYVYPREGSAALGEVTQIHPNIKIVNAPKMEISSSFIREAIAQNKNIRPLLPEKVWQYIDGSHLYKPTLKK